MRMKAIANKRMGTTNESKIGSVEKKRWNLALICPLNGEDLS
jgi:hypothetical protein